MIEDDWWPSWFRFLRHFMATISIIQSPSALLFEPLCLTLFWFKSSTRHKEDSGQTLFRCFLLSQLRDADPGPALSFILYSLAFLVWQCGVHESIRRCSWYHLEFASVQWTCTVYQSGARFAGQKKFVNDLWPQMHFSFSLTLVWTWTWSIMFGSGKWNINLPST